MELDHHYMATLQTFNQKVQVMDEKKHHLFFLQKVSHQYSGYSLSIT